MYKITLWDYNLPAIVSGTTEFYTDDIYEFKDEWSKLEQDDRRKKLFDDSLNGKTVSDWYSNSEEMNVIQEDKDARIIFEETYEYYKHAFNLNNAWEWSSIILVKDSTFKVRGIRFQEKCLMVGRYKLCGVSEIESLFSSNLMLRSRHVYGNPVLKTICMDKDKFERGMPLYDTTDYDNFKDDMIESICYLPMKEFKSEEEMLLFHEDMDEFTIVGHLEKLMRDISGEAG